MELIKQIDVPDLVRDIRRQNGWTQTEMGELIGVTRSQICMIESGRSDMPAAKLLKLLDEAGWAIAAL